MWAATPAEVAARHGLSPAHVLRFDANLPPFPAPLPSPAGALLADRGEYPEGSYRELREAAAAYVGCRPDEVAVDAGADGLIGLVARTFLARGRRAVVEEPTYPLYAIASRIEGAEVEAAAREPAALVAAARGAAVLWLCNPANPTGELWPGAVIAEMARELPGTIVAVDEAYFEYAGESIADVAVGLPNLVCVRTLSKAFGLAGLRVGYAVASRALAAELGARREPGPISTVAARLAAAALADPGVQAEAETTRAERERARAALVAAGRDAPRVHANFVVVRLPDARRVALELEARGLVVRAYEDFLRITVRSPSDDDLLLAALAVEAAPSPRRSATVLAPGARASLVLEGSGRIRCSTGAAERDAALERRAREACVDLELVAEASVPDEAVTGLLEEALTRAASAGGVA